MIKINTLPRIIKKRNKRLGQGLGSGKGKTSGRGTKGQSSRGVIKARNSIRNSSYIRRLPLYRGKYRNKSIKIKPFIININQLNIFQKNDVVNIETLIKKGIINSDLMGEKIHIKILSEGELKIPLQIALPCSKSAARKIQKAGGIIVPIKSIKGDKTVK
jgi:large subunit ribosomal protein L15